MNKKYDVRLVREDGKEAMMKVDATTAEKARSLAFVLMPKGFGNGTGITVYVDGDLSLNPNH